MALQRERTVVALTGQDERPISDHAALVVIASAAAMTHMTTVKATSFRGPLCCPATTLPAVAQHWARSSC